MYSIFSPLDPAEQLPRELLIEAKRHRTLGRRELAGVLWLPSLVAVITVGAWQKLNGVEMLGAVALLFVAFVLFALSDARHGR